jgi:Secretion system C-terminal sorting domain
MAKFKFSNKIIFNLIIRLTVTIFMFTISPNIILAQKQGDVWCFGDSALIDWTDPENPIIGTSAIDSRGSCSSVSTPDGELLFYIGDKYATSLPDEYIYAYGRWGVVYNSLHNVMPNGYILIGEGWYHEHIILPLPNDETKYYVVSLSETGQGSDTISVGAYYSIVDMQADSGRGDVILKNHLLYQNNSTSLGDKFMNDKLIAFQHGNGRDWWVFNIQTNFFLSDTAYFIKHLLNPFGIEIVSKEKLSLTPDTTYSGSFGKMVLSPDGNRLMLLSLGGKFSEYFIDRCTGEFELERVLYLSQYDQETSQPINELSNIVLGEYSSDGNLFYYNTFYTPTNGSYVSTSQINLSELEPLNNPYIIFSDYDLTDYENLDFQGDSPGDMKIAPNGKIYWSTWRFDGGNFNWPFPDTSYFTNSSMNLSVINSPDSIGDACNAEPFSFYLGGNRTYIGLPNNPNYRLGPLDGSPCDTLGINALQEIKPDNRPKAFTYPSPAKETVWLSIGEKVFKAGANPPKVTLYDVNGKKVFETKVQQLPVQLNIGKLKAGVYSGRLTFSGAEYYFKVVKE